MRSMLPLVLLLGACGLERSSTDTGSGPADDSVQGVREDLPGSSSSGSTTEDDSGDTTDSGDATDDTGSGLPTDDAAGDTDSGTVVGPIDAWVYIFEDTADVSVSLYGIANVTTGDYSEYSSAFASTTDGSKGNGWLKQPVTFTPGDVLSMNCLWSDGTANQRYCAEAGALLTNVTYIAIAFEDGTFELYNIGTTSNVGDAYIKDNSPYHDWMIVTTLNTTGDYTM